MCDPTGTGRHRPRPRMTAAERTVRLADGRPASGLDVQRPPPPAAPPAPGPTRLARPRHGRTPPAPAPDALTRSLS